MSQRKYGWVRDLPDQRDRRHVPQQLGALAAALPPSVDLRAGCPPVYDQGEIGSCTANAVAAALEFDYERQKLASATPSRLFIYYNERALEGTTAYDSGAQIRDGIKAVVQWGDCPETDWPYEPEQLTVEPSQSCYAVAAKHLALVYEAVDQDLAALRGCLAAGFPFVFGFTVYQSFEAPAVAKSGIVPSPHWFERALGGHAVMCVGYDDATHYFLCRNSWGPDWGHEGYFYFPYSYMTGRLSSDFWTIRTVE